MSETVITADLLNSLFDSCRVIYGANTPEWQVCWDTVSRIFEMLGFLVR